MTTHVTRALAAAAIVAATLGTSACSIGRITLDGTIDSETRTVTDFTAIDFSDAGDITVIVGPEPSLVVTADTAILSKLRTRVSGGVLHIDGLRRERADLSSVSYRITVPSLESLDLSGAGDVVIAGIDGETFKVDLSGAGSVTVSGNATRFTVDLSGAGTIQAGALTTDDVGIDLSGAGNVTVLAHQTLSADISGAGVVTYSGNPSVSRSITGVGSVDAA